jgi:hypothetical protein
MIVIRIYLINKLVGIAIIIHVLSMEMFTIRYSIQREVTQIMPSHI